MSNFPNTEERGTVKAQADTMTNGDGLGRTDTANSVVFGTHHLDQLCSALENSNTTARKLTSTTAIGETIVFTP